MRKLVLIVDDWERLERLEHALDNEFEVHCAGFGPEGIALALALPAPPDVIYLDLEFENMTEDEAIARIAKETRLKDTRVVRRLKTVEAALAALRG